MNDLAKLKFRILAPEGKRFEKKEKGKGIVRRWVLRRITQQARESLRRPQRKAFQEKSPRRSHCGVRFGETCGTVGCTFVFVGFTGGGGGGTSERLPAFPFGISLGETCFPPGPFFRIPTSSDLFEGSFSFSRSPQLDSSPGLSRSLPFWVAVLALM